MINVTGFQAHRSFTRENAITLASLAVVSYEAPARQQASVTGADSVRFLDSKNNLTGTDTGTQVTVVETPDALIVVPRGTPLQRDSDPDVDLQRQDVLNDLDARPVLNYDGSARVHAGFKRAADGIWDQLSPLLKSAAAAHKAIHFAGHSLGAAIATHLADRLHHETGTLATSLVTFGGPSVGWRKEREHLGAIGLADRAVRFVRSIDPVPGAVPFGSDIGTTVYVDGEGRASTGDGWHVGDRLSGVTDAVRHLRLNPLQAHYPALYAENVADPRNAATLDAL